MSSFTFAIVAKSDNPIYELVVSPKKEEPTVNQQNQFFLHAVRSTPTCFASLRVALTPVLLLLGPSQGAGHCRRGALEDQQHVSQGMYPSEHAHAQSTTPFIRPADCLWPEPKTAVFTPTYILTKPLQHTTIRAFRSWTSSTIDSYLHS